jgi:hypothetical protein
MDKMLLLLYWMLGTMLRYAWRSGTRGPHMKLRLVRETLSRIPLDPCKCGNARPLSQLGTRPRQRTRLAVCEMTPD